LEEAERAILSVVKRWRKILTLDPLAPPPLPDDLPPSARMALSDAHRGAVFHQTGYVPLVPRIDIASLLTAADPSELQRDAERAMESQNCRAVKLKVGGRPIADDLRRVETVANVLDARTTLRLDANRAWSRLEALDFWDGLLSRGITPEFIEEPTADVGEWTELRASGMPLAFDETLRDWSPDTFPHWHMATTVVLKPTILGGYDATVEWIDAAHAQGVAPVLSGCFESGVGHRMVALAAALTDSPAGLGTYRALADDVLTTRLLLDGDAAHPHLFLSGDVDVERLTRLT
jgi:O-succinylbenzoate synthase